MSETLKTHAELLQCSPRVHPAQFLKALNNRISQGYGKDIYLVHITHITLEWQTFNEYYVYFCPKKEFQATGQFQYILVGCYKIPWLLAH